MIHSFCSENVRTVMIYSTYYRYCLMYQVARSKAGLPHLDDVMKDLQVLRANTSRIGKDFAGTLLLQLLLLLQQLEIVMMSCEE